MSSDFTRRERLDFEMGMAADSILKETGLSVIVDHKIDGFTHITPMKQGTPSRLTVSGINVNKAVLKFMAEWNRST